MPNSSRRSFESIEARSVSFVNGLCPLSNRIFYSLYKWGACPIVLVSIFLTKGIRQDSPAQLYAYPIPLSLGPMPEPELRRVNLSLLFSRPLFIVMDIRTFKGIALKIRTHFYECISIIGVSTSGGGGYRL